MDDYSKYTWKLFLYHKRDMFDTFQKLSRVTKNEKGLNIVPIRNDHGGEFPNEEFKISCN